MCVKKWLPEAGVSRQPHDIPAPIVVVVIAHHRRYTAIALMTLARSFRTTGLSSATCPATDGWN